MNEEQRKALKKLGDDMKALAADMNRSRPSTPDTRPSTPDRLGDAIRELARTMAETGKDRMRLHVVSPDKRAIYEIRLLRTIPRGSQGNVRRLPRAGDHVIETEAFGPASPEARQMAGNKKE